METQTRTRHRVVVDHSDLARTIGARIRAARSRIGLTQAELAGDRYTKAYISALELGHAKPSMAALDYLAPRLGTTPDRLLAEPRDRWTRMDADLHLAAGRYPQAIEAYEDLLDLTSEKVARAEMSLALGEAYCRHQRVPDAVAPLSEAITSFEGLGQRGQRARAVYWLAYVHHVLDDQDEGRRLLRSILDERGVADADPEFEVRIRIALAQVEGDANNHTMALAYLEEARARVELLDLPRRAIWFDSLARARQGAGDAEGAIRAGLEALALFRATEATHAATSIENELALTFLRIGNLGRARELAVAAIHDADRSSDGRMAAATRDTLAAIELAAGNQLRALALLDEVLADDQPLRTPSTFVAASVNRARALTMLGRHDEAEAAWAAAAAAAEQGASPARRREVLAAWAETLAAEGRHAEAYEVMRRGMA